MRIVIVSPNRNVWSETFIAAHLEHLKGEKLILTDGHLPRRDDKGRSILGASLPARLQRALRVHIGGVGLEVFQREAVRRELQQFRPDVVLAEYGPTGAAMAPICAALRIPLVVHFHGVDAFHTRILSEHTRSYPEMFRIAEAMVVVSREMEQQIKALGCPAAKVHYNCYGVDADEFHASDPSKSTARFIAIGRFVDKKAPHLTILAFARALDQAPDIRLFMAGDGPLHDACVQLVQALGLGEAVDLPGVLPHKRIAVEMGDCRAFVQHSLVPGNNDHEGTPLAVLESMARALPIIATRHAGIPDVVEHEGNGLLCNERDIGTMAQHILRLAGDPQLAAAMGRAGRKRIIEHHQLSDRIAALQGILEAAAAG